jgi:alkyl hydroperoxide reductase subunit AhpC
MAVRVRQTIPDHRVQAYLRDEPAPIVFDLSAHRGSWIVLFFYPGDFTLICPTELAAFADRHDDFTQEGAVVLAVSTNSCFSHKAWFDTDPRLEGVRYPVIADSLRTLSRDFGVLLEDGTTDRGTFIIDPDGVLVHMSVTDHDVGRSVDEVLRLLRAFKTGSMCPADWKPGTPTMRGQDDWLAKVFPDLVGPVLDALGARANRVKVAAGDTIVAEGDPADRFFIIAAGEVEISRNSADGDEVKLAKLGRGQFFGEVGILAETARTATVRAVSDVELVSLSWEQFLETLQRSDRADREFSAIAKERIALAQ